MYSFLPFDPCLVLGAIKILPVAYQDEVFIKKSTKAIGVQGLICCTNKGGVYTWSGIP